MRTAVTRVTMMQTETFEPGALVAHRFRPGVWRIVGVSQRHAAIEPWDDAAAAFLDKSEAYTIVARLLDLSRLRPGRSAPPIASGFSSRFPCGSPLLLR